MIKRPKLTAGNIGTFLCPWCWAVSNHTPRVMDLSTEVIVLGERVGPSGRYQATTRPTHFIWECHACKQQTYQLAQGDFQSSGRIALGPIPKHEEVEVRVLHQYPVSTPAVSKAVPHEVRAAVVEAEKCLAIGAPNACGTMVRRAVHSICAGHMATGKDLYAQLDDLKTRQVISPTLWAWADELRSAGKVGAHPEWEALNPDEARYAVELLRALVEYIYILPAEVAARRMSSKPKTPPTTSPAGNP